MMHGLSGIGKTPLATTIGLAVSGQHLAEADRTDTSPSIPQHIDNFRAESGRIFKPAIFDDGNLAAVSSADIKGYIDTSTQVILWVRGGCLFAANQLRIVCNNPVNRDPDREDLEYATDVPHVVFGELARPAYNPMMSDEDFWPSVSGVFGPHRAYIRLPGAVPLPVSIVRRSL